MLKIFILVSSSVFATGNMVLAAAEGVDWVNYLLNGGPFAVVVLLIILDKITTTSERDRLRVENEVLRNEVRVLNDNIRKEIVPPLVQLNALMKDVLQELTDRGRYYPPPELRRRQ